MNLPSGNTTAKSRCPIGPVAVSAKANEPMRKWLFIKFRILKTAELQMVIRCHPIRVESFQYVFESSAEPPSRSITGEQAARISASFVGNPVAEQFNRTRAHWHQETVKNCNDETDRRESKSLVHEILSFSRTTIFRPLVG